MMAVVQKTMTPLHDVYNWSITEMLYYASYIYEQEQLTVKQMRKARIK